MSPLIKVAWVEGRLGDVTPSWTIEPSLQKLESIARRHLQVPDSVPCTVACFAQGAFNKLYTVQFLTSTYLLRIPLPVLPERKTRSEAATLDFVRKHASQLIPRVIAYDASAKDEELGFEWMIMEKLPGNVLHESWNIMPWDSKVLLVKRLVGILSALFSQPWSGIGNLYPESTVVGPIVSMPFFWDRHLAQNVSHGPFPSAHDWLAATLQFTLNDTTTVLSRPICPDNEDDESAREEAQITQSLANRLAVLIPRIFPHPLPSSSPESTILHHDDLSFHNLLVDDSGQLSGIIDWECVSTVPFWRACTFPSFLTGRTRHNRPDPSVYAQDEDGKPTEVYYEHLLEWEQTQLRVVFEEEMDRLQPEWNPIFRQSIIKNEFMIALMQCADAFSQKRIGKWLDQVEARTDQELQGAPWEGYRSLIDSFYGPMCV